MTISGISKTYSVTGWRIGYCLAPPVISSAIRKVHDFLTVGAPGLLRRPPQRPWNCQPSTTRSWPRIIESVATIWCRRWNAPDFVPSHHEVHTT